MVLSRQPARGGRCPLTTEVPRTALKASMVVTGRSKEEVTRP